VTCGHCGSRSLYRDGEDIACLRCGWRYVSPDELRVAYQLAGVRGPDGTVEATLAARARREALRREREAVRRERMGALMATVFGRQVADAAD